MNSSSFPVARRLQKAGIAFALSLATASLLFSQGRRFGRDEATKPSPAPIDAPTAFDAPRRANFATRFAALKARVAGAQNRDQKVTLSAELVQLALDAHFQNQGEGKLSLQAFDVALDLVAPLHDPIRESDIRMNRATTLGMMGRSDEELRELRQALELTGSTSPSLVLRRAEILYRLGQQQCRTGRYESASTLLDRSLRIRQKSKETTGEADCLCALGQVAYEQGQPALARQLLGEAIQRYAAQGKSPSRAAALGQLGDVALAEGELDEAERLYAEGLVVWRKIDQGYWTGRFLVRQARLALTQGKLAEAESLGKESLSLLETSNSPATSAWPLTVLAEVKTRRGDEAQARKWLSVARAKHFSRDQAFGLREVAAAEARIQVSTKR